jgi:hypothetical protein
MELLTSWVREQFPMVRGWVVEHSKAMAMWGNCSNTRNAHIEHMFSKKNILKPNGKLKHKHNYLANT